MTDERSGWKESRRCWVNIQKRAPDFDNDAGKQRPRRSFLLFKTTKRCITGRGSKIQLLIEWMKIVAITLVLLRLLSRYHMRLGIMLDVEQWSDWVVLVALSARAHTKWIYNEFTFEDVRHLSHKQLQPGSSVCLQMTAVVVGRYLSRPFVNRMLASSGQSWTIIRRLPLSNWCA